VFRDSGQSPGSCDDALAAGSVEGASPTTVGKAREELSTDFLFDRFVLTHPNGNCPHNPLPVIRSSG
jgi:hypothetical protein